MKPFSVEIYSDTVCPWCYISKRNIDAALEYYKQAYPNERQPEVQWMPFQLHPDLPPEGVPREQFMKQRTDSGDNPAEGRARLLRAAARVNRTCDFDRIRVQPNTLNAHRLTRYAARQGVADQVAERLFAAFFRHGENISDPAVLCAIGAEVGLDRNAIAAYLASDEDMDWVREADAHAKEIGVSTIPFLVFNDRKGVSAIQEPEALVELLQWARRDAARPSWLPRLFGRRF